MRCGSICVADVTWLINALGCEFDDRIPFCFAMLVLGFDIAAFQVFRQIKRYYFFGKLTQSSLIEITVKGL